MITLQQVAADQQPVNLVSKPGHNSSSSSSSNHSSGGVLHDTASGCSFVWQISLVDLDLKPLHKIPLHAALDQRIATAAEQGSRQLLQQHLLGRERW